LRLQCIFASAQGCAWCLLHFRHLQDHSSHPSDGFWFSLPAAESVSKDQNHDFGQLIRVCVSSTFMKHLVRLSVCLSVCRTCSWSTCLINDHKQRKPQKLLANRQSSYQILLCNLRSAQQISKRFLNLEHETVVRAAARLFLLLLLLLQEVHAARFLWKFTSWTSLDIASLRIPPPPPAAASLSSPSP
jgi:hypothetical protein